MTTHVNTLYFDSNGENMTASTFFNALVAGKTIVDATGILTADNSMTADFLGIQSVF